MKPRNWRTYYWYRPPTLACPPKDPALMERQYRAWCERQERDPDAVIGAQHAALCDRRGILSHHNGGEIKTYERKVIWLSARTAVRVVPCFTSAQGRYQPDYFDNGNGDPWSHWSTRRTGGSGVTTYWVMHDGRMVDSFLTQARAMAKARELAEQDVGEAIAQAA